MDNAQRRSDARDPIRVAEELVTAMGRHGPSSRTGEWKFFYDGWMEGALAVLAVIEGETRDDLYERLVPEVDVPWALPVEIDRDWDQL